MAPLLRFGFVLLFLTPFTTAVPPASYGELPHLLSDDVVDSSYIERSQPNTTEPTPSQGANQLLRVTKDEYLRILPLGASITQGTDSSTGNGYRKPIRDKLLAGGWMVNMVGTKRDGTMVDNVLYHSLII